MRLCLLILCTGSIVSAGCSFTGVLSSPDPEFLEMQERERQQEEARRLHEQAIEAHEQAMRMHEELTPPPIP